MTNTESPESIIEEFQTRLDQARLSEYVEVDLTPKNSSISLDRICSRVQGRRNADNAMTILLSLCDEHCKDIELLVHPLNDETSKERLESWYVRHGFIRVDGDNSMMRRNCCFSQQTG